MFELFRRPKDEPVTLEKKPVPPAAECSKPDLSAKQRAWVVILADGRCGYIHHYKINGLFGVRPVGFDSGLHYPNTSEHWTAEQKLTVPEELALSICEIRGAAKQEIPAMWRAI
jgi:hypothetical protein